MPQEINYVPSPEGDVQPGPYFSPVQVGVGAPTGTGSEGSIWFDSSTGDVYEFTNGSWVYQFTTGAGGGGSTQIATGSSDPVGAPAAGIVLFARTDVRRILQWDGDSWEVVLSEI